MFQELHLRWASAATHTYYAQVSTPGCTDALTDEEIEIGASDLEDSDSEPEESHLNESEAEEFEIQPLIRSEQERFEERRRTEQEMSYRMFQELSFGMGQWEYNRWTPIRWSLTWGNTRFRTNPTSLTRGNPVRSRNRQVISPRDRNILHRGGPEDLRKRPRMSALSRKWRSHAATSVRKCNPKWWKCNPSRTRFSLRSGMFAAGGRVAITARSPPGTALRASRGKTATIIEGHLPRPATWTEGTIRH